MTTRMPQNERERADGVFEGGGVKAIAFAGAIAAAEEEGGVRDWVNVAGTSAGALTAALLAVGFDAQGIRDALLATDYRRFADYGFRGKLIGGTINYFRIRGFAPGNFLREWLGDRFEEKLGTREPIFADVVRRDLPDDLTVEAHDR